LLRRTLHLQCHHQLYSPAIKTALKQQA